MKNEDISPAMAIVVLIGTGALFLGLKNYRFLEANWTDIMDSLEMSSLFLTVLVSTLSLNVLTISVFLERTLGYKKQGSRLRSIKRKPLRLREFFGKALLSVLTPFVFLEKAKVLAIQESQHLQWLLTDQQYDLLIKVFIYSGLGLGAFITYGLISLALRISGILTVSTGLPLRTTVKDHLTLGSIGEEKDEADKGLTPKWVVVPTKALNGNILVTGSIGTGKTQGTILTYVDQLFKNFSQTPTALILDPKGSFIQNVARMLKARGLSDRCIFLGDINAHV